MVDLNWADQQLKSATIVARNGGDCFIRTSEPVVLNGLKLRRQKSTIGYTLHFKAEQGGRYVIER